VPLIGQNPNGTFPNIMLHGCYDGSLMCLTQKKDAAGRWQPSKHKGRKSFKKRREGKEMTAVAEKTSIELTTDQKIRLQKDMGFVADELLVMMAKNLADDDGFLRLDDNMFIVMGKTYTVSSLR